MTRHWDVKFQIKIDIVRFGSTLAAIDSMAETLRVLPLPLAVKARIERLNIVRAIQGTTGIEGNKMTETEVAELLDRKQPYVPAGSEELENINADLVMKHIRTQKTPTIPTLTATLIKEIHLITTKGIQEELNTPGKYRREFRYANNFEFPDPKDVPRLIKQYIRFIDSGECQALHPVVRAVLAHFYLVSIHPFYDGNGRVARAVEAYILYHSDYSAVGFYSLANFYYRNRLEYIRELDKATDKHDGDLTEFAGFALNGFLSELADLVKIGTPYMRVIKYSQYVDRIAVEGGIDQRLAVVLKSIAESENGVTPQEYVMRMPSWTKRLYRGKTERTLRYDLTRMRQSGLIEEVDGRIVPNLSVIDDQS